MSAGIVGFIAGALAGGTVGGIAVALLAAGTDDREAEVRAYCIGYSDGILGRRPHPEAMAANKPANKGADKDGWRVV